MKLFIFEDPGLYYGKEFIPVVAENETEAYNLLCKYLIGVNREKHITVTFSTMPIDTTVTWQVIASTDLPLIQPGVQESLIHSFME